MKCKKCIIGKFADGSFCYARIGDGHDCDNCTYCGTDNGHEVPPPDWEPYGINIAHELQGGLTDPSY